MKAKEFVKKYDLDNKEWNPKYQDDFLSDLTSELLAWCETYKAQDNIKGFDNAVNVIRMKWDGISKKVRFGLPEGLWKYFYASVICKIREEMCPREMARRRAEKERRRQEWEDRHAWEREMEEEIRKEQEAFWSRMAMAYLVMTSVPVSSFLFMELPVTATPEEVKKKYRELSLKYHPDRGGDAQKMVELNDARNKCLKWAEIRNKKGDG